MGGCAGEAGGADTAGDGGGGGGGGGGVGAGVGAGVGDGVGLTEGGEGTDAMTIAVAADARTPQTGLLANAAENVVQLDAPIMRPTASAAPGTACRTA